MRPTSSKSSCRDGFTVLELLVVASIMLVLGALVVPSLYNTVETYKMRTAAMDMSGLMQRARSLAIRNNAYFPVLTAVVTQNGIPYTQVYVDTNNNGVQNAGERLIQLPANVSIPNAGNPAMPAALLGFTPQGSAVPVSFNSRGVPCVMKANVCSNWDAGNTEVGFVVFLRDLKNNGNSWAAISVNPAGRAKVWTWDSGSGTWKY